MINRPRPARQRRLAPVLLGSLCALVLLGCGGLWLGAGSLLQHAATEAGYLGVMLFAGLLWLGPPVALAAGVGLVLCIVWAGAARTK
ncbi:hypothetical protein [Hymenobacter weizhouensis]|uniref:hypothetical protein n=1 Tax=Hymenobacter sp. YIM 151500-1 TaxID=2987689 RepID=UPI002227CCF7|nr:hypothetical protein [Hymenobacter sp. YIM 151500-1]UYZ62529.1 hypothetical protein OIS53_16205 [Hymenobacter sp. YIM 151500-1]